MGVVEQLREVAPTVLSDEPVIFAYLFGSQANGLAHPRSDVDVALMLDETVPEDEHLETGLRLTRRLAEASGLGEIEVVILNDASLPLVGGAISTRKVIYSRDEGARVEFESRRYREFLDFQIHAEPLARALLRRAAGDRPSRDEQLEEWDEIHGFQSPGEFVRFSEWIREAVARKHLTEVPVGQPYSGSSSFDERWYQAASGSVWRLVSPDPPFRGVFERLS